MKELYYGYYGTRLYLPLSGLSRRWRRFSDRVRGKQSSFLQQVNLPDVSWKKCTSQRLVRIWEHEQSNGNIRISELGVIGAVAASCPDHSNLFEIGTFDGRTALNLALNSPSHCRVYTLDLLPDMQTRYSLASGERHMVEKEEPGIRYKKYRDVYTEEVSSIHQLYGDSATFDFSPYRQTCSLVFVDGSHAYDYALKDTQSAMSLVMPGGVILWHDYGIWEGVTRALEEIEARENYGLRNIKGTSLVYWKKDE